MPQIFKVFGYIIYFCFSFIKFNFSFWAKGIIIYNK